MPRAFLTVGSVAVAALIAMVVSRYRSDLRKARARISIGSSIAKTECGPIEYTELGQGPALLVVHGAGGGFDQGMSFGKTLAAKGFRVIAMSRFGYLRTPVPLDASAAAQADAHSCLLDHLGVSRAAIVGVLAGAPSALQMAIRHPDRVSALVLVVPAAYTPRPKNAPSISPARGTEFLFSTALRSDFLFWTAMRITPGTLIRGLLGTPPDDLDRVSREERARVYAMMEEILPVTPRRAGLLNDANVVGSIPRYDLEHISAPTLCVSVADDLYGTYSAARYTAKHVPGARFIGYSRGGHIFAGHQDHLIEEIAAFLDRGDKPLHASREGKETGLGQLSFAQ
jgi:pimeloyl-ACP methyl ester carboxylesterase